MKHNTRRTSRWHWVTAATITASLLVALQAATPPLETKDKVQSRVGVLLGASVYSQDGGGHTAKPGDYAMDLGLGAGSVHVTDVAFLNNAAQNDEMSFAVWIKEYDNADNSAFWIVSPSSSDGFRGWQAHLPNGNRIFFDTAGCCDGATQRIWANIDTFSGYPGDVSWWTNWHFFVFSKKADVKQIWIDGVLFLEGSNTAPLPTDFTELYIGADGTGSSKVHGLMDDFAVFGTALNEAAIGQLLAGTLPSALPASDKLLAYWDFNDFPGAGQFVSVTPSPDATAAAPDLVQVVHLDGVTAWDQSNVSLKVDDAQAAITLTRDGKKVTVKHVPNPLLAMQSKHKAALTYPGIGGAQTMAWEFTVGPYTRDVVASRVGVFNGASSFSADAGGRTATQGDRAADLGLGVGPVHVPDGTFLNQASANDEMSFALWIKEYDNTSNSGFWALSPSSSNGSRGWQAHVPNGNNIYFDTAGCCDGATQRINANIDTFSGYPGDVSWWTNWHFFVFSKKLDVKQVWIDGVLFLEGSNTAPLPADFTELFIGADGSGASVVHGLIDDFAVFGTALDEATVGQLYGGTLPTALPAADKLLAYWNFNDIPAGGLFSSFTPAPGATNTLPNLVKVVHLDGTAPWDLSKVSLKIDGAPVTASSVRTGNLVTVSYVPSPVFAQKSTHTATLTYPEGNGLADRSWEFTVGTYTKDVLHQYLGVLTGAAQFTADAGGHSAKPGDCAIDLGRENTSQSVWILDASFLNQASANDEFSFVAWQKLYQIADSSLFFAVSPSSSGGQRGIGNNAPWSNNNLYFDTAGCCDAGTQRISAAMSTDTFPDYSGTVDWWYSWHHMVFQKKLSTKEIWIDGKLFLTGESTGSLPTDFTTAYLGFSAPDGAAMRGILDEVAVFKTSLAEADIVTLAGGAAPNTLPATTGILAYWNFNDPPAVAQVTIALGVDGKIAYTGVLQQSDAVTGAWSDVSGATSPYAMPKTGTMKYYRTRQ